MEQHNSQVNNIAPLEEFRQKLPADFAPEAKAWVFQSSRDFAESEVREIKEQLDHFTMQWESHGLPVHGFGDVFFGNTLIFVAEEPSSGVSGCSTDGMVRVVRSIERQYQSSMFDRLSLMFYTAEKYQRLPLHQVQYALDKGYLSGSTLYFDVSVSDYETLKSQYIIPLAQSWIARHVSV